MPKIVPGILTNSDKEYEERLRLAENSCDLIQIDVVDGKFANNLTVGVEVIAKFPTTSSLEVQLMVNDALSFIDQLVKIDYVSRIIFPFECESGIRESIYRIKKSGKQAGISINPPTRVDEVSSLFDSVDLLLILAGNPGFSGQSFDEKTLERIRFAKKLDSNLAIEVDIGVNFETAPRIAEAGADFLVASSALFGAEDFYSAYNKLANLVKKNR